MQQTSRADYWAGLDLGKKQDYSVLALVRKDGDIYRLVGLKVFPLGTDYTGEAGVVGFVRVLTKKLQTVHRILIDQTGVGESVVEEAGKSLPNAEGIVLSAPVKQDIMNYLKMMMQQKRFLIPYQLELANELNIERFQLTKAGQIQFSHPDGTHDDRVWGIASLWWPATKKEKRSQLIVELFVYTLNPVRLISHKHPLCF